MPCCRLPSPAYMFIQDSPVVPQAHCCLVELGLVQPALPPAHAQLLCLQHGLALERCQPGLLMFQLSMNLLQLTLQGSVLCRVVCP